MDVPEVFFADAGGVNIAWSQFGRGPDVLAVPPMLSNMEIVWENDLYRRFLEYIAQHVRVTVFDKRGIGLSDKFYEAPTLAQRTTDILAVMDAAGLERTAVLGASEGGLISQLFTALHPERVDRLAIVNSTPGASGMVASYQERDGSLDRLQAMRQGFDRLVDTWGRDPQHFVDWFIPSQSANASFVRWMGRFQRQSATAADLRRQLDSVRLLDAADHLADIRVPTLVINVAGDPIVPINAGRYLAERIPDARFVEFPGDDHFAELTRCWQDIADTWLEFVTGTRPSRPAHRRVVTVVFTDIVSSTARAANAGDRSWGQTLDHHDQLAWDTAGRCHGTIVKSTGDGLLVRFDGPSEAIEFATQFRQAASHLDLPIRCGVHTGEVELRANGDITGTAVNLAARIEHEADDGDIFVSSTVREMLLGGDLRFVDRGRRPLKGFDDAWQLYALAD
jgi:class 3 adenylate cyclase